ncbi:hypothetical protein NL478_27460, partial [Klebsiella pneumoniae]|nr:hypothetical protein [Klebsiella pneumoniae]
SGSSLPKSSATSGSFKLPGLGIAGILNEIFLIFLFQILMYDEYFKHNKVFATISKIVRRFIFLVIVVLKSITPSHSR